MPYSAAQYRAAIPQAKVLADAARWVASKQAEGAIRDRYLDAAQEIEHAAGYAELAARALEPPLEPVPPTGLTDAQALAAVRRSVNHGGEWGGRAVWQERMGRPSAAELKYMPATDGYQLKEHLAGRGPAPKNIGWDAWVSSIRGYADRMAGDPNPPRLILGVPPWPHREGKWSEAGTGAYDPQYTRFWQEVKRIPASKREQLVLRFWEFNGSHYIWHVTVGGLYESGTPDRAKCSAMREMVRRFFTIGRSICGNAALPRYDHNIGGSPLGRGADALAWTWPGDEYVHTFTIDRYVDFEDVKNPDRFSDDIEGMVKWANAHGCVPGISEGSLYMDKKQGGKQIGGLDSAGAVECARRLHNIMFREHKSSWGWGDTMLFERCKPEGHFTIFTLGAPGTLPSSGASKLVRFPNGQSYTSHCPNITSLLAPLWAGPA